MKFPEAFLGEIRSRVSVSSVVGRYVKLARAGHEHKGLCPFHNEKTPSFTVADDKEFFHCFSCGNHGDVITFLMRHQHMSFLDAVEQLADLAGLQVPQMTEEDRKREKVAASNYAVMEQACAWFEAQLAGAEGQEAREYLARRGFSSETIARFRLGWAPAGGIARSLGLPVDTLVELGLARLGEEGNARDMFRHRLIFPISDRRGRVIGFGGRVLGEGQPKYLNSPASPIFDKGSVLFGAAHARSAAAKMGQVVAVEGYLDVIAMHQGGFDNAVAPLGTALTERQIEALWEMAPAAIICFDADGAGQRAAVTAAERALELLDPGRVMRFARISGGKDPDDLLREGAAHVLDEALDTARSLTDVIWDAISVRFPAEGAERHAMFERTLLGAASRIPDPLTRTRMLGEFRRRLRWQLDEPPDIFIGRSVKQTAPLPDSERLELEWMLTRGGTKHQAVLAWLAERGIDEETVERIIGGVGHSAVRAVKGRYQDRHAWPDAPRPALWDPWDGPGRVIIPVWEGLPGSCLLDLVAWDPRDDGLATRTGCAAVLNQGAIDRAIGFEARGLKHPVKVAETPLSWLQKRAAGEDVILIVDWSRAWDALGCVRQLDAESVELAEKLDDYVRPPKLHRPKIMVEEKG